MTYAEMVQNDFLLRDDLQYVTITNPNTNPHTDIENIRACTGPLNFQQLAFGAALGVEPTDCSWVISAVDLVGAIPEQGWIIKDSLNVEYVIISAKHESFGGSYVLHQCIGRVSR